MDRNIKHTSINTRTACTRRKPLQCLNDTRRTILISCSKPKIIIGPQVKTPRYLGSPSAQHTIITINSDKCPKRITSSITKKENTFSEFLRQRLVIVIGVPLDNIEPRIWRTRNRTSETILIIIKYINFNVTFLT